MVRVLASCLVVSLAALALGCPASAVRLTVRVQSGLRAEHEIARVEVAMAPGASCAEASASPRIERRDLSISDQRALGDGTFTASVFEGLPAGLYTVRVTALRPEGRGLAEIPSRCHLGPPVGLDMESATVAAQGDRFRVPYGTLLCVSDKPLHGEIKLPGQANAFYERAISQHLRIGIEALHLLKREGEGLHSRKLRSFDEPPLR